MLTNDGARLFYSNNISYEDFLLQNVYITTMDELEQLKHIDEVIKNIKSDYFDVTYSKNFKTNTIINIRLVFKTKDSKIIDEIYGILEKNIDTNKFEGIHLTRGIYKDKSVIQIGTTTKDKAIERVEKLIGVPRNSMIRIGDCGDLKGNDYAMLNCKQGYSVDKTNGTINSCFPVFDAQGNVVKGINATLSLIKQAKILPTVCLEKADKTNYRYQFALVEKNIVLGRNKLLNKYNNLINVNFDESNGIDGLFDKSSGSIIIRMYEW